MNDFEAVIRHYDALVDEGNDPVLDRRYYRNTWISGTGRVL